MMALIQLPGWAGSVGAKDGADDWNTSYVVDWETVDVGIIVASGSGTYPLSCGS